MLGLLIALVLITLVAGALGFTGLAAGAAVLARIVFFVMLAGIVILLLLVAFGIAVLT